MHQLGQGRIHLSVEENAEEVIKKETKKEKKEIRFQTFPPIIITEMTTFKV
jgi:hypothetical protein